MASEPLQKPAAAALRRSVAALRGIITVCEEHTLSTDDMARLAAMVRRGAGRGLRLLTTSTAADMPAPSPGVGESKSSA